MADGGCSSSVAADGGRASFGSARCGIACPRCTRQYAGLRYRVDCLSKPKRAAQRVERLEALLSGGPARLHQRPGRTVDRRTRLEVSLRRAKVVVRSHALRGAPEED